MLWEDVDVPCLRHSDWAPLFKTNYWQDDLMSFAKWIDNTFPPDSRPVVCLLDGP